jgi:hypothetical protein
MVIDARVRPLAGHPDSWCCRGHFTFPRSQEHFGEPRPSAEESKTVPGMYFSLATLRFRPGY